MNSPDIKPVRSEILANRKRKNLGGSSLLFIFFLGLINLAGLIVLGLWFFNASGYQQETGQSFIERISILEEQVSSLKDTSKDSLESLEQETKFLDKEIRKLWDISNKKNKKRIDNLVKEVTGLYTGADQLAKSNNTLAAKQRAGDLEIAKLEKAQTKLKVRLDKLDSLGENSDIQERIDSQEKAIVAFDAYRKQMNKVLFELQTRLNELQIKFEESLQ
tara:strand:- start:87 stop:743 length:657 start_codon:yes stop_codon:yes gene_type:complete